MENLEFNFSNQRDEVMSEPAISFKIDLPPFSKSIHEKAITRAQRYLVAEADLLESIIEIDKDKTYEKFGETHLTPYCVKFLGLSQDVAANFVRVARTALHVAELNQAIQDGKLCVTKAKTIASVVTQANKDIWIDRAQNLSKEKLEKEVAKESPKEKKAEKTKLVGDDRVRIEFELSEKEMVILKRAQDVFCQKKGFSPSLSELQKELINCYLEKHDPVQKAQRAENRMNKKTNIQKTQTKNEDHQKLKRSQDWSIATLQKRIPISSALKHQIHKRDQGKCQAHLADGSICGQSKWVHLHHIQEVVRGGSNTLENLITLCSGHHRMWHQKT